MANFSPSTYVLLKAYTDNAVTNVIGSIAQGMTYKGTVPTTADLPSTHNNGDLWIVQDIDSSAPGDQGAKAVWDASSAKWILFDEIPYKVSQLENDEFFLSQKVSGSSYVDNIHIDGTKTTHSSTTYNPHEYIISEIQLDRGTAASLANTTPKLGEPVFEYDSTSKTYKLKIGDGSTKYASLPYIGSQYELSEDEKSIHLQGSELQIYGFYGAPEGSIPRRKSGTLQWVSANDFLKLVGNKAIDVVETVDANDNVTETISVKYDNATVKVNSNNQLEVPIDNNTISLSGGKLVAKQPIAGDASVKVEQVAGDTVITGNYKAGTNITLTEKSDGVYIDAVGGGGPGNIEAGTAIKLTTDASTGATVINADYVAGDYINITTDASGKTSINVDSSAVSNTYRPVKLEGVEILSTDPLSGSINFQSNSDADGVKAVGSSSAGGKTITYELANKDIIQAEVNGAGKRVLKDLNSKYIILQCGNANFSV